MPITTNRTGQAPYFDDYNEDKKFYRILFRPGMAVQARELTQLQTILQNQIERFGSHIFSEGAMVIPGYANFDTNVSYVKVEHDSLHTREWLVNNIHGQTIQNANGMTALVVDSLTPFDLETSTILYIKYLSGDVTNTAFSNNQTLTEPSSGITFQTIVADATGIGSVATLDRGVYFIHGHFVLVEAQRIILEPFTQTPTHRIGLEIEELLVTPEDDFSLNDNAQGSPNFAAPGAHRLSIVANLVKKDLDTIGTEEERNFVELLRIVNGQAQLKVDVTDYSILEKTLARRTYDESGNYTVKPFIVDVKEHATDDTKLTLEIDPGIAYVQGYEIRTIAKNTVDIDKARETQFSNNATVNTVFGNYIRVTDVYGTPNFKEFDDVNLYDSPQIARGTNPGSTGLIGTARVRGIEYQSGDQSSEKAIYRLFLFDINTIAGKTIEDVKYIYSTAALFGAFSAKVKSVEYTMDGFIKAKTGTTISGGATRWLTNPSRRLAAGDWIYIPERDEYYQVDSNPTTDNTLVVTAASNTANSNPSFSDETYGFVSLYAALEKTSQNSLIWPLPNGPAQTIRGENLLQIDTTYTVRRQFENKQISATQITLNCSIDETFASYSINDYFMTVVAGSWTGPVSSKNYVVGDVIDIGQDVTVSFPSSTQAQFTLPGSAGTLFLNVTAGVTKIQGAAAQEKSKTLLSNIDNAGSVTDQNLSVVDLTEADVFKITKITMSADFSTAALVTDTDITDRYDLDDGQRDNYYDLGRIILKTNAQAPTGRIRIEYSYFEHGGNGNYFSVDSYGIAYEEIPTYNSRETGKKFSLRDCLDFRPRINSSGDSFDQVTGSLTELPKTSTRIDFHYYLNRIDKLYLSRTGEFLVKQGIPELLPKEPEDPSDGMTLYKLNVRAYTLTPDDVVLKFIENKRYTMRDIGKLEKRIENLEYYTTLTLLEKETEQMLITDSEGLDRFKNGFVVDPFTGHGVGDVLSPDYRCSIDFEERECRPLFVQENVNLVEYVPSVIRDAYRDITGDNSLPTPASQPVGTHYQITGDLVTLPYDSVVSISQPIASNAINVNPFAVFNFWGQLSLNPANDEWKDTVRLPDKTIQQEGNYESIKQVVEGYGTIWNEWETQWTSSASTVETLAHIVEYAQSEMLHRDILGNVDAEWSNRDPSTGELAEWPVRHTVISRVITDTVSQQSRSGVKLEVVPNTITRSLGDSVVNVAYIPFIRTREVQFKAVGLKPNTRVYAFFDDVDVNIYCSPWANPKIPEKYVPGNAGTPLVTDATGSVSGTFKIPNSTGASKFGAISFKTGQRIFKVTDRPLNDNKFTTVANANYFAQGIQETLQQTIISTRNAEIVTIPQHQTRVLADRSTDIDVAQSPWVDPIAQTFLPTSEGGEFVTELDIFVEQKDSNIPLRVQLREVVNGYPGKTVIPFADVTVDAADVNTNEIVNGVLYINGASQLGAPTSDKFLATKVTFPSPVYLSKNTEYSIVIMSNSNNYTCWVATVGQIDPQTGIVYKMVGTDIPVTEQPYAGSFFKSQNASTWTADQYTDLMFKTYKAQFDTSTTGIFVACNDPYDIQGYTVLDGNPFQTKEGSTKVRVTHMNHGYAKTSPAMKVKISGAALTNGIPANELNAVHDVLEADLYSYVIEVTTPSTLSGFGGGVNVEATKCRSMDVVKPIVGNIVLPNTNLTYGLRTTSRRGVHDEGYMSSPNTMLDDVNFTPISVNTNFRFSSPKQILSVTNETEYTTPSFIIENSAPPSPSLFMRCVLSSENENLSPVLDLNRLSLVAVGNKLDNPQPYGVNSVNYAGIDDIEITDGIDPADITFDGTTISTVGNTGVAAQLAKLTPGKYIELVNVPSISNPEKDGYYEVSSVVHDSLAGDATVTLKSAMPGASDVGTTAESEVISWTRYISETNPENGSLTSKYLTRRVVLTNPSTALRVSFSAYKSLTSNIKLYYKALNVDSTDNFDDIAWIPVDFDFQPASSFDYYNFKEYVATIDAIPQFNAFAVKIGFDGINPSDVPRIIDLRAIALDE